MRSIDTTPDLPESRRLPLQLHGVLVSVFDTGVLILGESGTGKSECALDLIRSGHTLVADDVVEIFETADGLAGRAPLNTIGLIAIRGLGIVNAGAVFGENVIRKESKIALCVEFTRDEETYTSKTGELHHDVNGYRLPKFVIPVRERRNLATLLETVVRLQTSKAKACRLVPAPFDSIGPVHK